MNKRPVTRNPLFWVAIAAAVVLVACICIIIPLVMDIVQVDHYTTLTIEAGAPLPVAADFLPQDEADEKAKIRYTTDLATIPTNIPGTYPVELLCGDKAISAAIIVQDTVAPTGVITDLTLANPQALTADEMVSQIQDATAVKTDFAIVPDLTVAGARQVTVVLTDLGGNTTRLEATLTIILDTQAPTIEGVDDHELYTGDTIAYRDGITVTDDQDANPQLQIDSSGVNLDVPGKYTATYTATDHAGNQSTVTSNITVYEKPESFVELEVIYAAIDEKLATIVKDSMTDYEKVKAVFYWIRHNTTYVNMTNTKDWMQVGYETLITHRGDCFSFFALNKLMLERLGIPTVDVVKIKNSPTDGGHYWSLVSVDGGETYYHVDITPRKDETLFLMVSDKFIDNYSAQHYNCFNRDKTLYPATPEDNYRAN